MILDTLSDCVILPHLCNWARPVRLRRSRMLRRSTPPFYTRALKVV